MVCVYKWYVCVWYNPPAMSSEGVCCRAVMLLCLFCSMQMHMFISSEVYRCIFLCVCMYVCMYVCMFVCMVCVYVWCGCEIESSRNVKRSRVLSCSNVLHLFGCKQIYMYEYLYVSIHIWVCICIYTYWYM